MIGSLINQFVTTDRAIVPEVGMGVTELWYTDREAGTVVKTGNHRGRPAVWFTRDKAVRTDNRGVCDSQEYEYSQNESAEMRMAVLCTDGKYHVGGKLSGNKLWLGVREEYYDFGF